MLPYVPTAKPKMMKPTASGQGMKTRPARKTHEHEHRAPLAGLG
jgi:hypothetical protein